MKIVSRFFTSVKLAIILFILIIAASVLGTLIPQGRDAQEYLVRYGQLGSLFEKIQLTHLYRSVWYIGLLSLFSLNILFCTLTRLSPKVRRVFQPKIEIEPKNLMALKIKDKFKFPDGRNTAQGVLKKELARHRYRVKAQAIGERILILGRKRILGRFGSDVVHLGILIILAGGILSGLTGKRENLSFVEGETIAIPGAGFSVRLDRFITEYYPNGSIKDWRSHLTVLEEGSPRLQKAIEVNHPLKYRGYLFYQSGYGWDWQSPKLAILVKKSSEPTFEERVELGVGEKHSLKKEDLEISAIRFLPDFVLDEKKQPATRSLEPNNPAVFLEGWKGEEKVFSGWVFANFPDFGRLHGTTVAELSFELKDINAPQYSVLQMAKDPGVAFIWAGCTVLMVGLFLAFYWPSREMRIILEEANGKCEVIAGGIAGKGWESFQKEFSAIMDALRRKR